LIEGIALLMDDWLLICFNNDLIYIR